MDLVPRSRGGKTIAKRLPVTVAQSDGRFLAIAGIKEGDQVITSGFETLVEGTPVKVNAPGEPEPSPKPKTDTSMPGMDMGGK